MGIGQAGLHMGGLTCCLDEFGVQLKRNDRDGEISKVELQNSSDYVDICVRIRRDVCLITIYTDETRFNAVSPFLPLHKHRFFQCQYAPKYAF